MPKRLFLFRHAEAVAKNFNQPDEERELTARGIAEAVQVAGQLQALHASLDVIYCSTAHRTRQTALLTCDTLKLDTKKIVYEEELYEASTRTLFQFLSKVDGFDSVMCVGHNPTMTYLAEYLTKEAIGDLVTGGVVIIDFNIRTWSEISEGNGDLVHYLQPVRS